MHFCAWVPVSKLSLTAMRKSEVSPLFPVCNSDSLCDSIYPAHFFLWLGFSEFYFNFEDSIFGKFVPSSTSGSRNLPHPYFIATPLLPCSAVDAPVKKFTGNDSIGDAHDHLTKAVHAFAHFSVIYSHSNILFCDLQGQFHMSISWSCNDLYNIYPNRCTW